MVALGGYGRGALCPHSDIDLLLLHDGEEPESVAMLAEPLLYPLWDAGFSVGHAVRTPEETAVLATERLDAATAMLDARLLAGDAQLFRDTTDAVWSPLRADPDAFTAKLAGNARDRRERFGSTSYLLEPELKEGGGGLRDIHAFGWLQKVRGRTLEDEGLLRPAERDQLEAAEEFLTRVRSALHLETGRATDRLLQEQQPGIAEAMGFRDEPRLIAVDGLMRAVFEHARAVDALTDDIIVRGRRSGRRTAPDAPADATQALSLVARATTEGRPLFATELDIIEAGAAPVDIEWTDAVRDAFLQILRAGPEALEGLEPRPPGTARSPDP